MASWQEPGKAEGVLLRMDANGGDQRLMLALGGGVLRVWGDLPRDVQRAIFEQAVVAGHHDERDESLREQLAAFLHDQHPRTEHVTDGA